MQCFSTTLGVSGDVPFSESVSLIWEPSMVANMFRH